MAVEFPDWLACLGANDYNDRIICAQGDDFTSPVEGTGVYNRVCLEPDHLRLTAEAILLIEVLVSLSSGLFDVKAVSEDESEPIFALIHFLELVRQLMVVVLV